jgi:hypothetical protein
MNTINFGDTITCAETGKQFVAAQDGISTNYARDAAGNVYSDEGVDIRERRELLDRTKPYFAYLSSDGTRVTGWKGNTLGHVAYSRPCKLTRMSYTHGKEYQSVFVRDVHGGTWYGRSSPGVCITLRPHKGA